MPRYTWYLADSAFTGCSASVSYSYQSSQSGSSSTTYHIPMQFETIDDILVQRSNQTEYELVDGVYLQAPRVESLTASSKARELLLDNLSPSQRATFKSKEYFFVDTPRGRYKIQNWRVRNIEFTPKDDPKRLIGYCIHPKINCPDEDTMLCQKLLLESNEELFLQLANSWDAAFPVSTFARYPIAG